MSADLTVLSGGTQTTLQDVGRQGYRHLGIPGGGAADKLSFALANFLVGNPWDAPALECALGGLHIRFNTPTTVALSGAQMWAQVNGQNVPLLKSFSVEAGDILTLSYTRAGCRAYIAVAGGLDGDNFLGSRSTYTPAELGGIGGRALKTGDELINLGLEHDAPQTLPRGFTPILSNHVVLRAISGPEWEHLTLDSRRYLYTTPFHATTATDRMGSRLKGDRISLEEPLNMTSSPLLPGSLQVPPDGQPILALADGHCTGGYARALQIIQADLWLLGQIAPGAQVSFRRSIGDEAQLALTHRNALYASVIPGFSF
ncbi:biotin-dependent carboxyltransferase family protein [Litorimonas sp. RW-G-Af-16]|uniref:5-oxoprolinase subunit C family protein n=1 Tax=Litorimonas sp. RW-G-Af-16 TaxID=3241168 RepID=UPI00390CCF5B